MAEFKSWQSFWHFEEAVIRRTRYVHGDEIREFLETVRQTAAKHVDVLPRATPLWRAQLGNDWRSDHSGESDFPTLDTSCRASVVWESSVSENHPRLPGTPCPFAPERMKPLRERAVEGRANPKGIPFLYLATDHMTAIGEVRPWIGSHVSVGLFKTGRELRLVNCTTGPLDVLHIGKEPPAEKREELVWTCIGEAFARPVTSSDDVADYTPTQVIAELFRTGGFDGVRYRSSLGEGHNIVLFDVDAAALEECRLFTIQDVTFAAAEGENPQKRDRVWSIRWGKRP